MAASLPWLLILGLSLPVVLTVPFILEHTRGRDVGPRKMPTTTLDLEKKQVRTARKKQRLEDPRAMPGLTRLGVDLEILEESEMEGNVVTHGTLTLAEGSILRGSGKGQRGIRLAERAKAYGNIISGGDVELEKFSYVQGIVYASGKVTLKPGAIVRGIFTESRVDIYPGAEILEDVIAKDGVHLVVPVQETRAIEELEALNALLSPEEFMEDEE